MSANGWITAARRLSASVFRRNFGRKPVSRRANPGLESLEGIALMSAGLRGLPGVFALGSPVTPSAVRIDSPIRTLAQSSSLQTAVVNNTLTNFNNVPFTPPITKFDPALGTLTSVRVTVQAVLTSQIKSQNTSTTSPANITPFINGSYTVAGLLPANQTVSNPLNPSSPLPTVTVSAYNGTDPAFEGASTVLFTPPPYPSSVPASQQFPSLVAADNRTFTLTSPGDLAFYTASGSNTTFTPTLTETGQAGATAPNGNLQTDVRTSGSGVVTVTYEYKAPCPNVVNLVRFGIHHQPTQLQLTLSGPLDPADASNPANYKVVVPNRYGSFTGPGVTYVPVTSAVYDPAGNTVTLTTARQLNVHHLFQLQVNLPCNNGNSIVIEFGGRNSLGGFTNPHRGNQFVPVAHGRVVRPFHRG